MQNDNWLRQTSKPLFPELQWSQPENKLQAGKLLIIGGTVQGFAAIGEAYAAATRAGVGTIRVVLPDKLQRTVSKLFPEAEFAPSTPSGSFAALALADILDASLWADGVLLPGDSGRNSETTVLTENLLEKFSGQVTLTRDIADLFCAEPISILQRPNTLLVLSAGQLQKLGEGARFARPFTSDMGMVALVDALYEFTKRYALHVITKQYDQFVVAVDGRISTTPYGSDAKIWRLNAAASASVWWLQNPSKPFEALTTAIWERS